MKRYPVPRKAKYKYVFNVIPEDIKDEVQDFRNNPEIQKICQEIIRQKTASEVLELSKESPMNWALAFMTAYKQTNRSFFDLKTEENKPAWHEVAHRCFFYLI